MIRDDVEDDAASVEAAGDACLITCEHASERLPRGWAWPAADRRLVGTHWSHDLGAADLAIELAQAAAATAVLARFSRLLADANRPEDGDGLFRTDAEGRPVELNQSLDGDERERRLEGYYRPFHRVADRAARAARGRVVLAVHTFTPHYEGEARSVELGVLFDREEALAQRLASGLAHLGHDLRLNEPYSGRAGLIHCADRHATNHGRAALELEVRQDLAVDAGFRARLVAALVPVLRTLL